MTIKEKFAQKMLEEKLDFLPLKESIELYESGISYESRFHWVMNSEELEDNGYKKTPSQLLEEYDEIYGLNNTSELTIGKSEEEFNEFTLIVCPAPTYIDLIK